MKKRLNLFMNLLLVVKTLLWISILVSISCQEKKIKIFCTEDAKSWLTPFLEKKMVNYKNCDITLLPSSLLCQSIKYGKQFDYVILPHSEAPKTYNILDKLTNEGLVYSDELFLLMNTKKDTLITALPPVEYPYFWYCYEMFDNTPCLFSFFKQQKITKINFLQKQQIKNLFFIPFYTLTFSEQLQLYQAKLVDAAFVTQSNIANKNISYTGYIRGNCVDFYLYSNKHNVEKSNDFPILLHTISE